MEVQELAKFSFIMSILVWLGLFSETFQHLIRKIYCIIYAVYQQVYCVAIR